MHGTRDRGKIFFVVVNFVASRGVVVVGVGKEIWGGREEAWAFARLVGLLRVIHPSADVVVAPIVEREILSAIVARPRRGISRVTLASSRFSDTSLLRCKVYCNSSSNASCSCCHLDFGLFPFGSKLRAIATARDGSGSAGRVGSSPLGQSAPCCGRMELLLHL
jgi:hypothetical protein